MIYVTGDAFYVDGAGQNTLRLSFSAPTPERIDAGVARLAATLRARTGSTGDSGRSWRPGSVVSGTSGGSCSTTGQPDLRASAAAADRRAAVHRSTVPERPELRIGEKRNARQDGPRRHRNDRRLVGRREEGELPVVGEAARHGEDLQARRRLADVGLKIALDFARERELPARLPIAVVQDRSVEAPPPARRPRGRAPRLRRTAGD